MAKNIFGLTSGDQIGRIDLFPDAFKSKEDLIRTVFQKENTRESVCRIRCKICTGNRARFEVEAYEAEEVFIVNLRKDGKF